MAHACMYAGVTADVSDVPVKNEHIIQLYCILTQ